MRILIKILLFTFLFSNIAFSQDIHFSQFLNSPLNLNPALTGTGKTDLRLVLNHRSQWNSFTNAYKTMSASVDFRKKINFRFINAAGTGILINNDKAGDGKLSLTGINIPFAVNGSFLDNNLNISIGIIAGVRQTSIDYSKFYFGSQFNGNIFDPNLPNFETFSEEKQMNFDFGAGMNCAYKFSSYLINTGINFNHINKPQKSFLSANDVIPELFSGYLTITFFQNSNYNISATYNKKVQGLYNEDILGGVVTLNNNNLLFNSYSAGIFYRNMDAIILYSAFNLNDIMIGLSYDINISKLSNASRGRGGFEFSLIYLFNIKKFSPTYPPDKCPDFI